MAVAKLLGPLCDSDGLKGRAMRWMGTGAVAEVRWGFWRRSAVNWARLRKHDVERRATKKVVNGTGTYRPSLTSFPPILQFSHAPRIIYQQKRRVLEEVESNKRQRTDGTITLASSFDRSRLSLKRSHRHHSPRAKTRPCLPGTFINCALKFRVQCCTKACRCPNHRPLSHLFPVYRILASVIKTLAL